MINLLILLTQPEPIRRRYADRLRALFPQITVNVADHHTRVGPYIESAEVLLTYGSMISDQVLAAARNLKWIQALTTGVDHIEKLPSLRPEVLLTSTRGMHGPAVSEAVLTAMLVLSRDFPRAVRQQEKRVFERYVPRLLEGKTVGIFGLGVIGRALAPKCKALGMTVIGIDPLKPAVPGVDRVHGWDEAPRVLPELDFIVLLIPSTPATRGIIGEKLLALMKPTSNLVNLGRGEVLDDEALIEVLRQGKIAGAALDVFSQEPLPEHHPYWTLKNVIITPHLGGVCDDYPERALPIIEENMRRYLAGDFGNMINLVTR